MKVEKMKRNARLGRRSDLGVDRPNKGVRGIRWDALAVAGMRSLTVKRNDAGQRLDKFLSKAVKGHPDTQGSAWQQPIPFPSHPESISFSETDSGKAP